MKKHATALRAFSHADDAFAKGQVILDMDAGQFADWHSAELVREATEAEIARAKGSLPTKPKASTSMPNVGRKPRAAKAAPAAAPASEKTSKPDAPAIEA